MVSDLVLKVHTPVQPGPTTHWRIFASTHYNETPVFKAGYTLTHPCQMIIGKYLFQTFTMESPLK